MSEVFVVYVSDHADPSIEQPLSRMPSARVRAMSVDYSAHQLSGSMRKGSTVSDHDKRLLPNPTPPPDEHLKTFEASAATAAHFLYAQSNLILALHHDTLVVDRRFDGHKDEVLLIVADNISDDGAGRLVFSYDASQTAVIWDLSTGQEITRLAASEAITVAAWTKTGNLALGQFRSMLRCKRPALLIVQKGPRKGTLSSLSPLLRSIIQHERSLIPYALWRHALIAEVLPLGQ